MPRKPPTPSAPSGLAADLAAATDLPLINQGPRCAIAKLLARMEPQEADALRAAIDSRTSASILVTTLRRHGHDLGPSTIQRHRAKLCRCARVGEA